MPNHKSVIRPKGYMHPVVATALLTTAQAWKQPGGRSVGEWGKQHWYVYTKEYYSAIKKGILTFTTAWMDPESIMPVGKPTSQRKKITT